MDKRLGILGGMGPQATQIFYQWILDRTDAACDQEHIPALILSDTEMPDRTAAILSGRGEPVFQRLLEDARLLERSGCTAIAIPCNTSHYFAGRLQEQLTVPILHMPRLTVERLRQEGRKKAAILATDGTVRTGIYHDACREAGIEPVTLGEAEQRLIMSIIYEEIKKGETGSREKFALVDRFVREAGCDGAILGCTELSVYRSYHGLPDFYIDAMEVLAEACILACGKKLRLV
ncbi:MAG: aspartate/glutamate racemase family protein [Oscillospiraceae bacterium]|nr:aspartate/glutamate racemase family protein [Oscillospiraceae bacterium]